MKTNHVLFLFSILFFSPNNISAHEIDSVTGILHFHSLGIFALILSSILVLALLRTNFIKEDKSNV
jgi:hypothetical protein